MSFLSQDEALLVHHLFKEYYRSSRSRDIFEPRFIERREFGYMPFGQKLMVRHLGFKDVAELKRAIERITPLHVYRSAALYHFPTAPMEEKGWMGAELIFDIDADHLPTRCKEEHDFAYCSSCGAILEYGAKTCAGCGSQEIKKVEWVCENCIDAARTELLKLIDFLENDLDIKPGDMVISFSGNRGYHLAVYSDDVLGLDRAARQEIVEYLTATNMDVSFHGLVLRSKPGEAMPDYTDHGWRGRLARSAYEVLTLVRQGDPETRDKLLELLSEEDLNELEEIPPLWSERARWDTLKTRKAARHVKQDQLSAVIKHAIERSIANIDNVVTMDVHRLLRLSNTLNGKTGLLAAVMPYDQLQEVNPFDYSVALPEEPAINLWVVSSPRFSLAGNKYGPYRNERVKLPAYAAAYLLCKGVAKLAEH